MKQYRGSELKEIRKKTGLSGPQMAEIAGVKYQTYWMWETDRNAVTDLAWEGILARLEKRDGSGNGAI